MTEARFQDLRMSVGLVRVVLGSKRMDDSREEVRCWVVLAGGIGAGGGKLTRLSRTATVGVVRIYGVEVVG